MPTAALAERLIARVAGPLSPFLMHSEWAVGRVTSTKTSQDIERRMMAVIVREDYVREDCYWSSVDSLE